MDLNYACSMTILNKKRINPVVGDCMLDYGVGLASCKISLLETGELSITQILFCSYALSPTHTLEHNI